MIGFNIQHKRSLSRRTVLKGLGVTLALPWLEAMDVLDPDKHVRRSNKSLAEAARKRGEAIPASILVSGEQEFSISTFLLICWTVRWAAGIRIGGLVKAAAEIQDRSRALLHLLVEAFLDDEAYHLPIR